jgi:glycosyltransferase involved in cell wall biosynthesis
LAGSTKEGKHPFIQRACIFQVRNKTMLRLTIWMNMPSFYQDDMFSALARSGEVDLDVIFAKELTSDRVQLGWNASLSGYRYRILNRRFPLLHAMRIAWRGRDHLHMVNGIWAEPAFASALCVLAMSGSVFAIHSEAPDPTQSLSVFKRILRKTFGKWAARCAAGILAVSHFAVDYYTRLGVDEGRIYPFGYFRAGADSQPASKVTKRKERTEVIFVGQLIRRKGLDILLEALKPLFAEFRDLHLTVVGAGEDLPALRALIREAGIEERVSLAGVLPADQVQTRVTAAQVLVLPSRWDGWGMVINEALSNGVPVIASDQCGAADLIRQGVNGYVFRSEDLEDLRGCLRRFLDKADEWSKLRPAISTTGQSISAEVASRYMIECMKHMTGVKHERPVPPWARMAISQSVDR